MHSFYPKNNCNKTNISNLNKHCIKTKNIFISFDCASNPTKLPLAFADLTDLPNGNFCKIGQSKTRETFFQFIVRILSPIFNTWILGGGLIGRKLMCQISICQCSFHFLSNCQSFFSETKKERKNLWCIN